MNEKARKTLELHENMDIHEWRKVSKSFEVCACGMCRGSESAFNSKTRRSNSRRRFAQSNYYPTDWQTLSELREDKNWIKAKHIFADRIKDYLIQFPYWAGYYAKQVTCTEKQKELMDVYLKDDDFLLDYAIKNNDFNEEIEARMRGSYDRITQFLYSKRRKEGTDTIEVSDETREFLLINGGADGIIYLGRMEGPSDDTRARICEIGEPNQIYQYAEYVDKCHSDEVLLAIIAKVDPKETYAFDNLYTYVREFSLFRDERAKAKLLSCPRGARQWLRGLEEKRTESDVNEVRDILVKAEAHDELRYLLNDRVIPLTEDVAKITVRCTWGGDDMPSPKHFDRKVWKVLCANSTSYWARGVLENWKRHLRNKWTEDISRLEIDIRDLKTQGKTVEARLKSKECAALKAWAHGILVDYKRVIGK